VKSAVFPLHSLDPTPSMHYPRACFTPCPYKALLYLVSTAASSHRAVESFSPHNTPLPCLCTYLLIISRLRFSLIYNLLGILKAPLSHFHGELIVLTELKQMAHWEVENEVEFRLSVIHRKYCGCHCGE